MGWQKERKPSSHSVGGRMIAVLCWDLLSQAVSILCVFIVKVNEYVSDKLGAKTSHLFF